MECVSKINLLGLQMTVKSGLDIIILKFLQAQKYFSYFIKMTKFINKITFFAHGGISMKFFVMYLNIINKTLKQRSPPIFHFEYVNKVWICGILGVKMVSRLKVYLMNFTVPLGDWLEKKKVPAIIIKQQFGFPMSTT